MTDLKTTWTTWTAVITGIANILGHFNIIISEDIGLVLTSVGIALLGYFAKDKLSTN